MAPCGWHWCFLMAPAFFVYEAVHIGGLDDCHVVNLAAVNYRYSN